MEKRPSDVSKGLLFLVGLALAASLVLLIAWAWLFLPAAVNGLLAGIGLEFVTGREAAFPAALAAGAPPYLVAAASVLQNLAVAALVSPILLQLLDRWRAHDHFLARRLRRLEAAALRHRLFVTTWGPMGLFGFMLVPFLANGALVSLVVARVCAIPVRNAAAPIVAATLILSFAWAYAIDALLSWTGRLDSRIPALLATALVATVIIWAGVDELRERRSARRVA